MKMDCEVLGVESTGDTLQLKVQGRTTTAAAWRPWCKFTMEIPATDKAMRAFHIGRKVSVTISAE